MGGKQKRLTKARRTALQKDMMQAFAEGRLNLGGQPIDQVLDGIDEGIKTDVYRIEVTLDELLAIWSGAPAPEEAQTAAGAAPETAPAAAAAEALAVAPIEQNGHPAWSSAQQAVILLKPDGTPIEPSQTPYTGPGSTPHMQEIQATADARNAAIASANLPAAQVVANAGGTQAQVLEAAMTPVAEIGVPQVEEPEAPVNVDMAAVAEWYQLAVRAQEKIAAATDVLDHAKQQVNDFLDQIGGPDRSKSGKIDGREVVTRTFVRRKNFKKAALLADHPEIDPEAYTDETTFYKTTLK